MQQFHDKQVSILSIWKEEILIGDYLHSSDENITAETTQCPPESSTLCKDAEGAHLTACGVCKHTVDLLCF